MKRTLLLAVCGLFAFAGGAWGRGGGGCLEAGTPIDTPRGPVLIEQLRPGDAVWAVVGADRCAAVVQQCYRVEPPYYLELVVAGRRLRVTPEHPFQSEPGVFRAARALRPGDSLWLEKDGRRTEVPLEATRRSAASRPAFNLTVQPGATFFADGIVVHNKGGGCFRAGTPILRPDGTTVPIDALRVGDVVQGYAADGKIVSATVRHLFTHVVDEYAIVTTSSTRLEVTREHPFLVAVDTFRTLEALAPGDVVYLHDEAGLRPEPIRSIDRVRRRTRVYNLLTDAPHTYFAGGVVVHNKGGGGGGHGGGFSGGRSGGFSGGHGFVGGHAHGGQRSNLDEVFGLICFIVFFVFIVIIPILQVIDGILRLRRRRAGTTNLDFAFDRTAVDRRAAQTAKLLAVVARDDPMMEPTELTRITEDLFRRLQKCWEERAYEPLRQDLMTPLYAEHVAQLDAMKRSHEINRIEFLQIENVAIVHFRYTRKPDRREFTALITAKARDYYVDDRTDAFRRGDQQPERFQEFWTFQRLGDRWRLRDIEQPRDSDLLRAENEVETMSVEGRQEVEGGTATKAPAGPWADPRSALKETRVERLLNFLAQRDPLWDRTRMLERARRVFLDVMHAQEEGDPDATPEDELFEPVGEDLKSQLRRRRETGTALEFRNLCIRKVELVLVRNYTRDEDDEFTVRIRAHAQKVVRKAGTVASQDDDVMPFEQYWTFGRSASGWRLKEVLPPARGQSLVGQENVDEDSTREQLEWYYTQEHA